MAKKRKADGNGGDDIDLNKPTSQAKYAKARGVSPQFISKLVGLGKIPRHRDGKKTFIIPAEADKARAEFADPSKEHRTKENTPDTGKAGSTSEADAGELFNDKKVLDALKNTFTAEEIKLFEKALQKVPAWTGGQRILAAIKASNELLDYQEKRDMLVDAVMVEQTWADKLSMVRAKFLTVPKKMAHRMAAMILRYAAKFGRELSDNITIIKKKKSGQWKYNQKAGALQLFTSKGKKPFISLGLSAEAPDHAETLAITEAEQALGAEVFDALNELTGEGEDDSQKKS